MSKYGPDLQREVYQREVATEFPMSFGVWEEQAHNILGEAAFDYVAGGAGLEKTMQANLAACDRWRIRPRMLRGAEERNLETSVLGTSSAAPFLLAPVGVQSIVHPEAEVAVARAAAAMGIPFILSTVSSTTIEDVAAAMGNAPHWFQLYPLKLSDVVGSFLKRAEKAGYSAVVVTLDTTLPGYRPRDLRKGYLPFTRGIGVGNFVSDPVFRKLLPDHFEEQPRAAGAAYLEHAFFPGLSWKDIDAIRKQTDLPLLLKGITHPEDAKLALKHDVQGIIVSNHGGRQVDGAIGALDALPEVCEAVQGKIAVLMDSGIRTGGDIFKATALGAAAVLVGRPYVYGLAVGGERGVRQVIRNLMAELDLELVLSGYRSIVELDRSALVPAERRHDL